MYRPSGNFNVPLVILRPETKYVSGVSKKVFPTIEQALAELDENGQPKNLFFGSFKTYGGTEKVVNGLYSIENTAVVEGWYRPDLKADCRVGLVDKGKIYEVYADIEDIEERHQFMKFKLKYLSGGV